MAAGDEALPDGERLLAVLGHRAGHGGELRAAFRAEPPGVPGGGSAVAPAVRGAAGRAGRMRAPQGHRLAERPRPDSLAAPTLRRGGLEQVHLVLAKARDHGPVWIGCNHGEFLFA